MLKKIRNKINQIRYELATSTGSVEKRFSAIYRNNFWFSNKESRSGAGSTKEATANIRQELPDILKKLDCKTLLDIGCGDYNWMKRIELPCNYIGVDIVQEVIDHNQKHYAGDTVSFFKKNAIEDPLDFSFDVALCREVLFHLSYQDGLRLIENVVASEARFFITTTNIHLEENKDIPTGKFRNINLNIAPYSFPESELLIRDDFVSKDRYLAVFDLDKLRK